MGLMEQKKQVEVAGSGEKETQAGWPERKTKEEINCLYLNHAHV